MSAIEQQIITESLRRVPAFAQTWPWSWRKFWRPTSAGRLLHALTPDEAAFALSLVGAVIAEIGGHA